MHTLEDITKAIMADPENQKLRSRKSSHSLRHQRMLGLTLLVKRRD